MSHDSGFRRGGQNFSNTPGRGRKGGGRSAKRYEDRMTKRFHEHEKSAQREAPKDTESS